MSVGSLKWVDSASVAPEGRLEENVTLKFRRRPVVTTINFLERGQLPAERDVWIPFGKRVGGMGEAVDVVEEVSVSCTTSFIAS